MIATALRRGAEDAFVVRTDEPDLSAALPELQYLEEGEQEFVRRFRATRLTPVIYERFAACIQSLLAQAARRESSPWQSSLLNIHHLLGAGGVEWLLCGSAALAIRGVEIVPRDIDLTVADQRRTVDALGHLLVEPPVKTEGQWIAEWFARAWDGTRIEWVAETRADLDDARTSDLGPEAVRRAETVSWRGLDFRVPPLDLQAAVSRERGLHDRASAIEALSRSVS